MYRGWMWHRSATSELLCVIKAETRPPLENRYATTPYCTVLLLWKRSQSEEKASCAGCTQQLAKVTATLWQHATRSTSWNSLSKRRVELFIILGRWWEFHFDIKTQSFYFNANADATDVTAARCLCALESQAMNRTLCRDHNYCTSSLASMH